MSGSGALFLDTNCGSEGMRLNKGRNVRDVRCACAVPRWTGALSCKTCVQCGGLWWRHSHRSQRQHEGAQACKQNK